MIRGVMFSLALLTHVVYANTQEDVNFSSYNAPAEYAVEYVRICSLYGSGYFYIPGSDTCVHASTGVTKKQTANGTVTGMTQLAYRVAELERKINLLTAEKK